MGKSGQISAEMAVFRSWGGGRYAPLASVLADRQGTLLTKTIIRFSFLFSGTAGCKISAHSMNTFILASTFTLAYISIERYMCICHPRVTFLKEITGRIILGLWLVSITIMLPYLIFCKAGKGQTSSCDCHSEWSSLQYYTTFKFVTVIVGFLVPLLTMLVCYSQICIRLWGQNGKRSSIENDQSGKKKRSIKMMILATLLFFISWFPYMALFLVKAVGAGDPSIVG